MVRSQTCANPTVVSPLASSRDSLPAVVALVEAQVECLPKTLVDSEPKCLAGLAERCNVTCHTSIQGAGSQMLFRGTDLMLFDSRLQSGPERCRGQSHLGTRSGGDYQRVNVEAAGLQQLMCGL